MEVCVRPPCLPAGVGPAVAVAAAAAAVAFTAAASSCCCCTPRSLSLTAMRAGAVLVHFLTSELVPRRWWRSFVMLDAVTP